MTLRFTQWLRKSQYAPWLIYAVLAAAILGPLLLPGYVSTLDMVFTPHPPLPDVTTSSFIFHAIITGLSYVVPADLLQKAVLLTVIICAGVGMQRLATQLWQLACDRWVPYLAGVLYIVNPFVYERFMAGHYAVLLGYAFLPFFAGAAARFVTKPSWRPALQGAFWAVLISVVSIHTLGIVVTMTIIGAIVALWRHRQDAAWLKKSSFWMLAAGAICIAASSYWLVPLLLGQGATAAEIQHFGDADRFAFATTGGDIVGGLSNILRLQGFWAEAHGLFILPQQVVPFWGLLGFLVFITAVVGFVWLWRYRRAAALTVGISGVFAIWFSLGTTYGWAGQINLWFFQHVPLFAGFREPQKFVALLAFVYALLVPAGCWVLWNRIRGQVLGRGALIIMFGFPFLWTPTMLWGFAGQLRCAPYPDDWYQAKAILDKQPASDKVLFLPWHEYMTFTMAGRTIANPAEAFFGERIIASHDPELGDIGPAATFPMSVSVQTQLLPLAEQPDFARSLRAQHISYIVLAKENDYQDYAYLDHTVGLKNMYDGPALTLYAVTAKENP